MTKPSNTRALTIVAWMFIADGVWTALVILVSFLNGYGTQSGLGLFNIWFGVGLLLRRPWALSLAPISLFISIAMGVFGFVILAFNVWALFKASDTPGLSGTAPHRSLWWLALDPRILVPITIVILVAIHLESNLLESRRLQIGMEECLNDFHQVSGRSSHLKANPLSIACRETIFGRVP